MILRTLLSHRRRTHNIGQASARETYGNTMRFIKHTLGAGLAAAAVAFAPSAHANPVDEVPCASGDCARECMDVCYDITGDYGWAEQFTYQPMHQDMRKAKLSIRLGLLTR